MLGRGLNLVDGNDNEWKAVTEFGRVCERRKLQANVGKSKVMRCTRNEDGARLNVMLNGEARSRSDQIFRLRYSCKW